MLSMPIQVRGFRRGKKTFPPRISIKTLENRLIQARNQKFHPTTGAVEMRGGGSEKTYRMDK